MTKPRQPKRLRRRDRRLIAAALLAAYLALEQLRREVELLRAAAVSGRP
ncbi:MAG: hypothetical protein ABI699_07905 [Caldimonas sp.]